MLLSHVVDDMYIMYLFLGTVWLLYSLLPPFYSTISTLNVK